MVHLGHDLFQKLNLINVVSMFLLVIIFFILQYIFDMEFVCSCQRDYHQDGYVYFIGPPVILTWVVYVTEPFHQARIFSCFRGITDNKIVWFCVELFLNYISLGGLWVASILFDGDWYICLMTNGNGSQTGIPCKKDLTQEENQIKAGYKTESLDWGLCVIVGLVLIWSIAEIKTAYCNRKKTWKSDSESKSVMLLPPYYRKVYEGLLAQKVSDHLKEELTKIAIKRAKAICQPHLRTIGDHEQPPNSGGDGGNRVSSTSTIEGNEQPSNSGGDGGNRVSSTSAIEGYQQPTNNRGDGSNSISITVLEAWQKISAWDFPFSSNESQVGTGRAAGNPSPEGMNSGNTM